MKFLLFADLHYCPGVCMGINREDTPNPPFDKCGCPAVPRVQSARICLD